MGFWASIGSAFRRRRPADDHVAGACAEFFLMPSWSGCKALLEEKGELLLSDAAQVWFSARNRSAEERGDRRLVPLIDERRALLVRCRLSSIPAAIAALPPLSKVEMLGAIARVIEESDESLETVPAAEAPLRQADCLGLLLMCIDEAHRRGEIELEARLDEVYDVAARFLPERESVEKTSGAASRVLRLARLHAIRGEAAREEWKDCAQSVSAYISAIQTFQYLQHDRGIAIASYQLSFSLEDLGQRAAANEALQVSIDAAEAANWLGQSVDSRRVLGRNLMCDSRHDEARGHFEDSLELSLLLADKYRQYSAAQRLFALAEQTGDKDLSKKCTELMLKLGNQGDLAR